MSEANGSDCQPDFTWENWAGTIEFQPDCFFEPTTMADLTAVLQQAYTNGKKARVVGSGHSWSLGAVPGTAPYTPDGKVDAYLISVNNMNPGNASQDPYLQAIYFKDSAGAPYVGVPPGTTQGWFADNAARNGYALASMGPAPDITLGGFIANGCHGTGWEEPTVADLVVGIEVMIVDADGNVTTKAYAMDQELADLLTENSITLATPQVAPDEMKGFRVGLGALGVLTKLVFQLEPLFRVKHLDETVALDQVFPTNGDYTNLETLVTSCDYTEIFWFPFTDQLWVKRYSKTDAGIQHPLKVITFTWITSELAALTGGLLGEWFSLFPAATPLTLKLFFGFMKLLMNRTLTAFDFNQDFNMSQDPIVNVNTAYLYQTKYFTNLLDLSYTVPIVQTQADPPKHDFSKVMDAWTDVVNNLQSAENNGQYPLNLNVHLRFIKNSDSLLSPANQPDNTTHTCYIEYLSFSQQLNDYTTFTQAVGPEWATYGGLPHWAKIFQLVPDGYSDAHSKLETSGHLAPFLALQKEMDPNSLFQNAFLNELLNGAPSEAEKPVSVRSAARKVVKPTVFPAKQFQLGNAGTLQGLTLGRNDSLPQSSARGCLLVHDLKTRMAILVDESRNGHLLQYSYDSGGQRISYRLLSPSDFLAPGEVFRRVEEVLISHK